ncbi:MAG: type II toxin-antitoxin system RelE/ParE family toxin [Devosia sp.]|jgi:toxin ParE1/3/4
MRVRFSTAALTDLTEIAAYIAADSPRQAERFVTRIEERCASLDRHPLRNPVVRIRQGVALRRTTVGSYAIFYEVAGDEVFIARIVHAARAPEGWLPEADES